MDYEGFKKEIYKMTGINLTLYKEKQMKRRIDSLIEKNRISSYENYVTDIKVNKQHYNEFINFLTINVSEFYRNPEQWKVLESEIIPMLLEKSRILKIWSSACSTGDEPYTLAMVLSRFIPLSNIKILATDIDKEAMNKAKAGVYGYKSVENLPKDLLQKYFVKDDEMYKISEDIKKCVEFKQLNLLEEQYPSDVDLLVCRNVLIYFTDEAKNIIYSKFNKSLKNGGILFVGSTEQIIMSNKYGFKPVKTFFYSKI
jgi:Methylase of chemotaxis methyl-accepting proteins